MKGSFLTLVFYHVLFLPSFALHHWSRHVSKHHNLARDNLLDRRSINTVDRQFTVRVETATIDTIRERRLSNIVGGLNSSNANFSSWCGFVALTLPPLNVTNIFQGFITGSKRQVA